MFLLYCRLLHKVLTYFPLKIISRSTVNLLVGQGIMAFCYYNKERDGKKLDEYREND